MSTLMRLFKSDKEQEQFVSTMVDPFTKDGVQNISLYIRKGWDGKSVSYSARVDFEVGPTKGEHKIEAIDFPSLCKSVEGFLKQLEP